MKKAPGLLAAVMLGSSLPAFGALTLTVDTDAKTFWFTGFEDGTPMDFAPGAAGLVRWNVLGSAAGTGVDSSTAIASTIQEVGLNNTLLGISAVGSYEDNAYVRLEFNSADPVSLVGTDTAFSASYAGWSQANQNFFESLNGQSMTTSAGSGFSPISVVVIPEAATTMLAGLGLVGLLGLRRRA